MKNVKRLAPSLIQSANPQATPYRIWDHSVPQLHIRIQPSGTKSWNVQWSRTSSLALGKWPGVTIERARTKARAVLAEVDAHGAPTAVLKPKSELTVADACHAYIESLKQDRRDDTAADSKRRFERCVFNETIGKIRLAELSQSDLEKWRLRVESGNLAPLPVLRGRPPAAKPLAKATVNRMRTVLVAALNHAVAKRAVHSDQAIEWRSVKPLKDATRRRDLYLTIDQRRQLLNQLNGPLRELVECVALTGCRPGDPVACLREDYDGNTKTVMYRTKGHHRAVTLGATSAALFDRLAHGKPPKGHLFTQLDGSPWTPKAWSVGIRAAAHAAGLPAGLTLYTLRHCWITDAISGGMDLLMVARLAGTSLTMIEKHYGHLSQSAARDKLSTISFI